MMVVYLSVLMLTWNHRFGWVNASYVYGLEILNAHMRRSLGAITPYDTYRKAVTSQDSQ